MVSESLFVCEPGFFTDTGPDCSEFFRQSGDGRRNDAADHERQWQNDALGTRIALQLESIKRNQNSEMGNTVGAGPKNPRLK